MSARAHGQAALFLYRLHRVMEKLSGGRSKLCVYLFCAQPVGNGAFTSLRDDPNTVVQPVGMGSTVVQSFPRPPEVVRQRFERGSGCYAATVRNEFAGHLWTARGGFDEDEVRCRYELPSDGQGVWDYDVYVEPRFRAGRTLGRLWKAVDVALGAEGVRWSFSRISLFNPASVQAHERLGAVHLATGIFAVLGPVQLSLFSKAPFIHFGVRSGQRPRLRLTPPATAR